MKKTNLFAVLALAATPAFLHAQTTNYSDVVGYVKDSFNTNSDTIVTLQLQRPSELTGAVSSVSDSGSSSILTLSSASLTANQFVYVSGSQPILS